MSTEGFTYMNGLSVFKRFVFVCTLTFLFIIGPKSSCMAGTYDDAVAFYETYGERAVFVPENQSNGYIYMCIMGKSSSAAIKYYTLGWKATVSGSDGAFLDEKYLPNDGSILKTWKEGDKNGYHYNLYRMELRSFIYTLNGQAYQRLSKGQASIHLDACDTVRKNGNLQGEINENGVIWGSVYTSYDGIVNAAPWTATTKENLKGHFDKKVENLFYTVRVSGSSGISSVSGEGSYCYGIEASLDACLETGYEFSYWSGKENSYSRNYRFYVTGDSSWTAYAKKKQVSVKYCRNAYPADTMARWKSFSYGADNQYHLGAEWTKEGYHMIGWNSSENGSGGGNFFLNQKVSDAYIEGAGPSQTLYAKWKANTYQINFDGNGASLRGANPSRPASYREEIQMPENSFDRGSEYQFLGWGMAAGSFQPEYLVGQSISVESLVKRAGLEWIDGGTITLYAIWDQAPSVEAYNLYFPLQDAHDGKLTLGYLQGFAKAIDREDGPIAIGNKAGQGFWMEGYEGEKYKKAKESDAFFLTYICVDSRGNRTSKQVEIHFADTEFKTGRSGQGQIRFLSRRYLYEGKSNRLLTEEEGGLWSQSIWRKNPTYRDALQKLMIGGILSVGYLANSA